MTRGILWLTLPNQQSPVTPLHGKEAHLHVTLKFNVTLDEEIRALLGSVVEVVATANCHNDRIQALRVFLPEHVAALCNNADPHMTISMVDGVKPVESNEMLKGGHESEVINIPMMLKFDFFVFGQP